MRIDRRSVLKGIGAGVGVAALGAPAVRAQAKPVRIGFMTVKTGPLASGGIQMEQALNLYLKERNNMMAGVPVELYTVDTGGAPAVARTKMQELVERNGIAAMIGPLSTQEALALDDYIRETKTPTISVAAADDMTQRRANPWFVRVTSTSSQCAQVMGDYAAKDLKYKRCSTIADDIAYGHEQNSGFQRVFEEEGGKIVQKLWPPLAVPDYGTYIAQINTKVDGMFAAFAGSNGFRFFRQFNEYGLKGKIPLLGGMTAFDESLLQQMGDDAIGLLSVNYYSATIDTATNKKFVAGMVRDYKVEPGYYGAATYTAGAVLEAALKTTGGKDDKQALMNALRTNKVEDTVRGPVAFDKYGNAVGNIYIRRVEKQNGRLVNAVIKTYENVSQFWKYNPEEFLKNPVYSRDYPPAKFLEN
ncbi:ABC transporter substrate-binding protein [Aquabacter spiritensis]|uniref:Amino acid/amide ABC transporter substrate-binding protein (HAAT family) n=1 Tax=Aquabacter spiritensis TaxID=933073 RepID=A0A4R3LZ66_9HYPH|nr:ABC transporter substrate-binding protein [Aquabacter spiritensis]TCT05972.1 amino acid/amide ABC transporter substrate-binding protein (HAAT family) [Aquabacter spiritensis]